MSAYVALLVSESKLKAFTAIHNSVSPQDLRPFIVQSQDLTLHEYLGSTFYRQLQNQVVNNSVTTANRTILDDYISPALCNLAMYYALPYLTFKVHNKSVLKPQSENSQTIGLDELKFLQSQAHDVSMNYLKQMQTYLKNNLQLYPAYAQFISTDGYAPKKDSPFFSGIQTNSKTYRRKKSYTTEE